MENTLCRCSWCGCSLRGGSCRQRRGRRLLHAGGRLKRLALRDPVLRGHGKPRHWSSLRDSTKGSHEGRAVFADTGTSKALGPATIIEASAVTVPVPACGGKTGKGIRGVSICLTGLEAHHRNLILQLLYALRLARPLPRHVVVVVELVEEEVGTTPARRSEPPQGSFAPQTRCESAGALSHLATNNAAETTTQRLSKMRRNVDVISAAGIMN